MSGADKKGTGQPVATWRELAAWKAAHAAKGDGSLVLEGRYTLKELQELVRDWEASESDRKVSVGPGVAPGIDAVADGADGYCGGWSEPFEVAHVSKLSREILRARAALERARLEECRAKDKAEGLAKLIDDLVSIKVVHGDIPVRLKKIFSVEVVS